MNRPNVRIPKTEQTKRALTGANVSIRLSRIISGIVRIPEQIAYFLISIGISATTLPV